MLSSVLKSRRALDVNIAIMRAFVHVRELLATHKVLARRLDELEQKYDGNFAAVFAAIRDLMSPPLESTPRPRMGSRLTRLKGLAECRERARKLEVPNWHLKFTRRPRRSPRAHPVTALKRFFAMNW